MKHIIALLVAVASLFITPAPADASGPAVMIQGTVSGQDSNIRKAVRYVDKYTSTHYVYGACRYDRRCIIIQRDNHRPKATAYSSWLGSKRKTVTIRVNPGRGDAYMTRLFAHELGHAMFLPHSTMRTNLMWPTLYKRNGHLVPMTFTATQRKTLRKH